MCVPFLHDIEIETNTNIFFVVGARETVVDFSIPYYLESSTVLSKAPAPSSKAFAVFSPFTFLVIELP